MHIPLLTILLTRQWGRSTCVPAVFRLVTHTLTDERFTETEACELLGTVHGQGTNLGAMIRMLRMSRFGLGVTKFREVTRGRIDDELASGSLVVCGDQMTYRHGYVITVIGDAGDRYRIVDPVWGVPTRRDKGYVVESADGDAFSVRRVGG